MQTTTQLRFTTKILLNILGPCPLARASLRRSKVRKRSKASFSYQRAKRENKAIFGDNFIT